MKWLFSAALFLFASAADAATLYDQAGRPIGSSRVDSNGVTRFYDKAGRPTGTSRVDANGRTRFYDAAGRPTGSIDPRR